MAGSGRKEHEMGTLFQAKSFFGVRFERPGLPAGRSDLDEEEWNELIADLGCRVEQIGVLAGDSFAIVDAATFVETESGLAFCKPLPPRVDGVPGSMIDRVLMAANRLGVPAPRDARWWVALYRS